jgi:phosphoglycerate kinase
MKIRSIQKVKNLAGKKVLVRVDFNVPVKAGKVVDDYKIVKSLATIKFLVKSEAQVILVSHLGRPVKRDPKLSLKPIVKSLEKLLKKKVKFFDLADSKKTKKELAEMKDGEVVLLENIRFFKEEIENTVGFAKDLAKLADIFVLDGFAVAHRASASVSGVAKYLPSYAGLLLTEEVAGLSRVLKPKKPLVLVLGGAKIETKIPLLKNFINKANYILIGGGISNTYLSAQGKKIGSSLVDKNFKKEALFYCQKKNVITPVDYVVGTIKGKLATVVQADKIKITDKKLGIYDIGPATIKLYASYIKKSRTLIWNGAFGYFEQKPYQFGTHSIARLFAAKAKGPTFGVIGGGETQEVIQKLKLMEEIDLVSTGGGAMLEFLIGEKLPGIEGLKKRNFFGF